MSDRKGLVNKPKRVRAWANCNKPDAWWYDEPYGLSVHFQTSDGVVGGVIKERELRALIQRLDRRKQEQG